MEKKEYLTEENYKKGKKIILLIAFLILMCGVIAGGYLILSSMPDKTTPTENKDSLSSEKEKLIAKKKYDLAIFILRMKIVIKKLFYKTQNNSISELI